MWSSASNATRGHSKSENTSENNQNDSVLNHDKELALGLSPIDKNKLLKNSMELNEIQKGADQVIANDFLIMANQFNVGSVNYQLLN